MQRTFRNCTMAVRFLFLSHSAHLCARTSTRTSFVVLPSALGDPCLILGGRNRGRSAPGKKTLLANYSPRFPLPFFLLAYRVTTNRAQCTQRKTHTTLLMSQWTFLTKQITVAKSENGLLMTASTDFDVHASYDAALLGETVHRHCYYLPLCHYRLVYIYIPA